jgi:dTDP-4-amino-4,6-dideoxygalactose transaminase
MDPERVADAITQRTRAIVPVHLFGQMAPMTQLKDLAVKHGLSIVEDAAQCQGAKQGDLSPGSLASLAATSFYPGKNLGAYGDAGAITTNDDNLALRVRRLRNYGGIAKYEHVEFGCNSRLDSLQAAVLTVKLKHLDEWNRERSIAADWYMDGLRDNSSIILPSVAPDNVHVWHLFVAQVDKRDEVLASLNGQGIGAGIHYPQPVHRQPGLAQHVITRGDLKITERLAARIISLPIFPGITFAQVERTVEALSAATR